MRGQRKTAKNMGWALCLLLAVTVIYSSSLAYAGVNLTELERMPAAVPGLRAETALYGPAELPPQDVIVEEVRHLETKLPFLAAQEIPVYLVRERCFLPGVGWLAGCTFPGEKAVYLFASPQYRSYTYRVKNGVARLKRYAPYLAAYTVAHEFGHILRYQLVSEEELNQYLTLRGTNQTREDEWASNAEEIFAEDFRWLFGSEKARQVPYLSSVKPPGEKERELLLKLLREEDSPGKK
uniref:Uncharacterized protein n=1 Tax=Ammonifex degensii TaxID=42838 RepID=A0A7C1FFT4_9THEO